jgi:hypothetical protein
MYLVVGVLVVTAAGIGVAIAAELTRRDAILRPPTGKARITDWTIERGRRSSTGRIYYQRDGGATGEEHCVVPPSEARTATIGAVVNVYSYRFFGARELIEPCARAARAGATLEVGALAVMALAALVGAAWLARRTSRLDRVLREGAPAAGRVRAVRLIGRGARAHYRLAFSFDAAGGEVQGSKSVPRDRALKMFAGEPTEGLVIEVVYDPADARHHELWGRG